MILNILGVFYFYIMLLPKIRTLHSIKKEGKCFTNYFRKQEKEYSSTVILSRFGSISISANDVLTAPQELIHYYSCF